MERMETLRETVAAAIPPHSFISSAHWDGCSSTQRDRRLALADHVLAALALDPRGSYYIAGYERGFAAGSRSATDEAQDG